MTTNKVQPGDPVTRENADRYTREMRRIFHAVVTSKEDAPAMALAAEVLKAINPLIDVKDFLENTATTLGPLVFLPSSYSPESIIRVLTHEIMHVIQFWLAPVDYGWLYLAEPEARANYEAQAYGAGMEIEWLRKGVVPDVDEVLSHPADPMYMFGREHIAHIRNQLVMRASQLSRGVVTSEAARAGWNVLRTHMPHLLHSGARL